jgi:hypothetical protein
MMMSSWSTGPPSRSSLRPRWVRTVDILCLLLVIVALIVATAGDLHERTGAWRLAVTSPYPLLLCAIVLAVVRHLVAPAQSVYRDLSFVVASSWREPAVRTAAVAVAGTRPVILCIGYLAVMMVGYGTGPTPPPRAFDNEVLNLPMRWDAGWYLGIVTDGYRFVGPNDGGGAAHSNVAFLPAYPMLVRALGRLLGGRLTGYIGAGLTISFISFFGALIYLYQLARETLDDERAQFAVWLVAAYPFAVFFGAIYVESLFLLGITGAFYHFRHGEFGRAFLWGVLVGLTKTNGFLVSLPLAILALQSYMRKTDASLPVVSVASAAGPGVGMLMFSGFMWQLTGDPLAWLRAHQAWGRTYRGLIALSSERYKWISQDGLVAYVSTVPHEAVNALGAIFVLATVWPVARRLGVAYATFILIFMLPPLAAGGFISAGRFSSVLFPAFIWMAMAVRPSQRLGWIASFAAFQALNAALFYTWRPLY